MKVEINCIVLYCIVSYRIVSYRIVSYRIVSYRIVSYRIVLYCIVHVGLQLFLPLIWRIVFNLLVRGYEKRVQTHG